METGKILSIRPTQDGGYQGKNGYIYTFDMTVQLSNGPVTGEIGSKTNQYPMGVGQDICVEVQNTEYGPKFKKVNPQYNNQGGGNQGGGHQQGNQQGGQQQRRQAPPAAPRDYDKENRGKCAALMVQAAITAGMAPSALFGCQEELLAIKSLSTWLITDMPIGSQSQQMSQQFSQEQGFDDDTPL